MCGDSTRRYSRGTSLEDRCHRNSELDLVGTLPKRKQDTRNGGAKATNVETNSSQPCVPDAADNDLLMQIVHKPDCELVRHRQQLGKCIDLKLSKLAGGEPQDQGYASERSPEDEHPPSLPGQPFPNITPGEFTFSIFVLELTSSNFRIPIDKSLSGLFRVFTGWWNIKIWKFGFIRVESVDVFRKIGMELSHFINVQYINILYWNFWWKEIYNLKRNKVDKEARFEQHRNTNTLWSR